MSLVLFAPVTTGQADPQQYSPRDLKVMSDSFTFDEKEPTLSAMGNRKPYLIKIDVCEGKVVKETTEAGYFPAGIQMIRLDSCPAFFVERKSEQGRHLLKQCPVGTHCHV